MSPRAFLLFTTWAALAGCGMNPQRVDAIIPEKNFSNLSCEQLAAEKARIEAAYLPLRWENQHGAREAIGRLNGEARAVDAAAQSQGCQLAPVRIPSYPHKEVRRV